MTEFSFGNETFSTDRIICDFEGDEDGSTVVFIGGIHGNEASGVIALQNVVRLFESSVSSFSGRVMAVAGNLAALAEGVRCIDADLNRLWTKENMEALHSGAASAELSRLAEYRELKELDEIFRPVFEDATPTIFLDLHTTSSQSVPFIGVNDFPGSHAFSKNFSPPTILGLDTWLEGPFLTWAAKQGHAAMAFEAGQHDDPRSISTHESFVFQALAVSGVIDQAQIPDEIQPLESTIPPALAAQHVAPHLFEVIYRHHVDKGDGFRMRPGFENLAPVRKGETVAESNAGDVLAPEDGLMFMPLYQTAGTDGFFLVRLVG